MKFIKIVLGIAILFSLSMFFNMYRFGYGFENGFWRTLMTPFEGTAWAPDFSESAFNKIKLGMSVQQVEDLLGKPIRSGKECKKICFWIYSWQDTPTADFDQRWVGFGPDHRVVEIRKSFFID